MSPAEKSREGVKEARPRIRADSRGSIRGIYLWRSAFIRGSDRFFTASDPAVGKNVAEGVRSTEPRKGR